MAIAGGMKEERNSIGRKKSKSLIVSRTSLASMESLSMPLVQEVVLLADFRCAECQKRVADIISRNCGETESVVVSLLEKKVTLTCRYTGFVNSPGPRQVAAVSGKPPNKVALVSRLFRSSCN